MPIWTVENRSPSFIDEVPQTYGEGFQRMLTEEFSVGCSLYVNFLLGFLPKFKIINYHRWGNTPAMDVINLPYNEKDANRDFSLAFVGLYSSFYCNLEWQNPNLESISLGRSSTRRPHNQFSTVQLFGKPSYLGQ